MISGTKPLFTLTIEEFAELTRELVNEILKSREKTGEKQVNEKEEHYNIKGTGGFPEVFQGQHPQV
jgi:hypothetical protein